MRIVLIGMMLNVSHWEVHDVNYIDATLRIASSSRSIGTKFKVDNSWMTMASTRSIGSGGNDL